MRRQAEGVPGSSDGSGKISGRIPSEKLFESSATEFWDKMGKMAFVDCDNSMCDRLFMGLSRVKMLGSGGFASVFSARWRHVSMCDPLCPCTKETTCCAALCHADLHALCCFARVHIQYALSSQVDVAVKILVSNGKDHVDEMTKVEAQICEGLRHPNVIQVRSALSGSLGACFSSSRRPGANAF